MATPNFITMENFPLYARQSLYHKVCPECYMGNSPDAEVCEDCGASLAEVLSTFDEDGEHDEILLVERSLEKYNNEFTFHKIVVKSGYYTGVQLFVEDLFCFDKVEDMDNDEAHYYYGDCRSKVIRRHNSEVNKVRKVLARVAADYGFDEYLCIARFSNGEASYSKIDPKKGPTLRQAAKAVIAAA